VLFVIASSIDLIYEEFIGLINSLFIEIIKIPFQEQWIPSFLGLVILVIINGAYFMVMDNVVFHTLHLEQKKEQEWSLKNEETDLLDQ
jgi:hypothetical protein